MDPKEAERRWREAEKAWYATPEKRAEREAWETWHKALYPESQPYYRGRTPTEAPTK